MTTYANNGPMPGNDDAQTLNLEKLQESMAKFEKLFPDTLDTHIFASSVGIAKLKSFFPAQKPATFPYLWDLNLNPFTGFQIVEDCGVPDEEIQMGRLVYEVDGPETKAFKTVTKTLKIG